MPAESELVKYYDVSRVTVRQALEKLSAKKVITRKAGRGTFLTQIPETIEHDLSFPSEFKEKIMHFGIELIARVLLIEEIHDPQFAKHLEIKETERNEQGNYKKDVMPCGNRQPAEMNCPVKNISCMD